MTQTVYETNLEGLRLVSRGKVRDIYDLGEHLLIVTTDRLSAYDVILPTPIPGKGEVLTRLSVHWFGRTQDLVPNHLVSADPAEFPEPARRHAEVLAGRSMLVKKAKPLPVECIVRGYLSGSGWKDYQRTGAVCGIPLPEGLRESERLPEPIFTPSTKAEVGDHDENIPFSRVEELIGPDLARRVRDLALAVYQRGADEAADKGILIADTKMEFGLLGDELILIDELLTPDSSRFWRAADYRVGVPQESLDKQYVRDYLSGLDWDKTPPGPELPPEVVTETSRRYREILGILTGQLP
ncbi:phosphoribosylaminoimidazolesuccinocarboxamide synthase [Deferrisoma camini]|uniref:phosphoribosylaminoimidazolesuccinocarboxamide synthase n=1 Tax=Deferrisoma camini TaxID=1035120 RepID=UPI00046C8B62|nr:phosphoribosylaminoimidazolesuccinocarboxamide synthase [Deferrisoma camini]